MVAPEIARLLNEFGRRLTLCGGNPYRAKAYIRAAERVALLTEPIDTLIVQNRLQEIPGVGPAIAQVIIKLHETGTYPSLEKMRAEFPETLLEMLTIPGLRPDKILKLHSELGVSTLERLVAACLQDKLKGVRGLGPALQRKNEADEKIGSIDDLLVTRDGKEPYAVLSVGGFLGMGTRLVVVRYDSLKIVDNKIVLPGGTNEALKMLPAFEYSKE